MIGADRDPLSFHFESLNQGLALPLPGQPSVPFHKQALWPAETPLGGEPNGASCCLSLRRNAGRVLYSSKE
jgi:hypothetical protein